MAISKQIEGYPDYYVSSAGNVWRKHRNETFMRLRPDKLGLVNLCTNGKCKLMLVYRLVAQAFVPITEQYQGMSVNELEVHHIDHNRKNNRASNLMWLTKAEHKKLHSESDVTKKRRSAALKGKPNLALSKVVAQYTKNGEFVATYASAYEAARQTKVHRGHISECCNGKLKSSGGYIWKFAS